MAKARTLVGLDVHAAKTVAAILDAETGELRFERLNGSTERTVGLCSSLPAPVRATYEAGPTGYRLARRLRGAGIDCLVAAPGKIPRGATDRVRTDRRDAEHLVRLLLAGRLHPVWVPGPEEEALRDLVRAREDLRTDLMRLAGLEMEHEGAQAALLDYRGAVDSLAHRRRDLEGAIERLVPDSPWERAVGRLRCLRGIDTLTAVGLCCEVGDFRRFRRAAQLMSFLGLVPSESSTGERRRLGSITRSGSRHARRLLVEAAWHYRRQPRVGRELESRQAGQPAEAIAVSWSAQRRLHRVWGQMQHRGKRRTLIAVAAARELAGFCWSIVQID